MKTKKTKPNPAKRQKKRQPINIIFNDGYAYISQRISGNPPIRYLKCTMRHITGCKATGKIPLEATTNDEFTIIYDNHNHSRNDDLKLKTQFMALLKTMCSDRHTKVRNIYLNAKECDPEGASVVPFDTVQSSMRKWQSE